MRLGWDEIKRRAKAFSEEWADAHYEKGETHSFYNAFFEIFGMSRRAVAVYEKRVMSLDANKRGFIDLFWPGVMIVEQKSAGRDLLAATAQASTYFDWLPERDQPRYMMVCDFQRFKLTDLDDNGREISFALADLHKHIEAFDFILGRRVTFATQAAVNIKAAELMGKLHDALEEAGYTGHDLEQLLVRLLFCLFADDTGIFQPKDIFLQLIDNDTREDGSDTGRILIELFDVLNCAEDARQRGLSGELNAFPYVNGDLFGGHIRTPVFDAKMRTHLLDAARHDWSEVSPAIFGSLFQSVMDAKERRAKGAHYTAEDNILKVIGPLFLDDLQAELDRLTLRKTGRDGALKAYLHKLATLTFFDPACGCGNFLVIAYREIRRLELAALRLLHPDTGQGNFNAALLSRVTVDQFYGIEVEEFPAAIAKVAMWMMDHIANNAINAAFRTNYARIPLRDSAHIVHGDALEVDWAAVLPPARCSYIMGNPPFIGQSYQSLFQREQMARVINAPSGKAGSLDYVAAWFIKAGMYVNSASPSPLEGEGARLSEVKPSLVAAGEGVSPAQQTRRDPSPDASRHPLPQGERGEKPQTRAAPTPSPSPQGGGGNKRIRIAFVATNSITQGEQVAQLWPILFDRLHLEIAFAHRTFSWGSEARGKAHVHVVIIGLAHRDFEPDEKRLFSYPDIKGDPVETRHSALTAYLFDARGVANRHMVVRETQTPITPRPNLQMGSKLVEGGHYIFDAQQRRAFLEAEPNAEKYMHPLYGAQEFIRGSSRWILALQKVSPDEIGRMPMVKERIKAVREYRASSKKAATQKLANFPQNYEGDILPVRPFLVVPQVSSEQRDFIPIGWIEPPAVPSDKLRVMLDATIYDFAILTSTMHMAWMRAITGRMKSDYMYSVGVVYNTFPWPVLRQGEEKGEGKSSPERGGGGPTGLTEGAPSTVFDGPPPRSGEDFSGGLARSGEDLRGTSQRAKIEALAQAVLDARAVHTTSSLADLYDPDTMPANLRKAHAALDLAVDRLYRAAPFASDRDRVEHLFGRYEALVNPLERIGVAKNKRVAKRAAGKAAKG